MKAPVLHVLAWHGDLHGPSRYLEESLVAQRAHGLDARAFLSVAPRIRKSPLPERLRLAAVPVTARTDATSFSPGALAQLHAAVRGLGPEAILHSHGERALLWCSAVARLARVRHVHTLHGFIENDAADRRRVAVARRLLAGLHRLVVVHSSQLQQWPAASVVSPCLHAEEFARNLPPRDPLRARHSLSVRERAFLFLGRVSREKGADLLALVQAELQKKSEVARLFVAGDGPLLAGVEAMTDVRLLGQRDDAAALLYLCDVIVAPSRRECMPMIALEAAAVGTPVAAFAVGGFADTGLAVPVPVEDVVALVTVALDLVRDVDRRLAVTARARGVLDEAFSRKAHMRAIDVVYS